MSYDVYLRAPNCPTCGHKPYEPDCPDPTYNLTPIFDLALTGEGLPNPEVSEASVVLLHKETDRPRGLRLLNGRKASETLAQLNHAIDRLSDETLRDKFVALEPPNKWGTLPDALYVMNKLRDLAAEYPNNFWEVR